MNFFLKKNIPGMSENEPAFFGARWCSDFGARAGGLWTPENLNSKINMNTYVMFSEQA